MKLFLRGRVWWFRLVGVDGRSNRKSTKMTDEVSALLVATAIQRKYAAAMDVTASRSKSRRKVTEGVAEIYFIQAGDGGPIKIGISSSALARMQVMQSDNHADLKLLHIERGTMKEEHAFHKRFAVYRIRGEWFEPAESLLEEIKRLAQKAQLKRGNDTAFAEHLNDVAQKVAI